VPMFQATGRDCQRVHLRRNIAHTFMFGGLASWLNHSRSRDVFKP